MTEGKEGRCVRSMQRTTDLLCVLLAQEARALRQRRREQGGEGDLKQMKEMTAVLKDLSAVAKTLNEQGVSGEGCGYGVVLLPAREEDADE